MRTAYEVRMLLTQRMRLEQAEKQRLLQEQSNKAIGEKETEVGDEPSYEDN